MTRVAFILGEYPPEERNLREKVALSFSSKEVEVGIVPVPVSPYMSITPTELQAVAPAYIKAFQEAERQGYDAIVPLGTLDLGVDGGRSVVDIPIIGPMECMLAVASLVGDRFGILTYAKTQIPVGYRAIKQAEVQHKIAGWRGCGVELPDIAANKQAQIDAAIAASRDLIDNHGANVILPMGITLCPVNIDAKSFSDQIGVPVIEGIGAPIRMAGLLASLGLRQSRAYWPKSSFGSK